MSALVHQNRPRPVGGLDTSLSCATSVPSCATVGTRCAYVVGMSKQDKKASWLAAYEDKLNEARPETTGKVDWDTAIYLYNTGLTVGDAVERYIVNHPAIFGN